MNGFLCNILFFSLFLFSFHHPLHRLKASWLTKTTQRGEKTEASLPCTLRAFCPLVFNIYYFYLDGWILQSSFNMNSMQIMILEWFYNVPINKSKNFPNLYLISSIAVAITINCVNGIGYICEQKMSNSSNCNNYYIIKVCAHSDNAMKYNKEKV